MENFKGPVFIVGMPRSGTKLLRDLLNQHSKISIPEVETHFIPLFIKKYGKHFNFNKEANKELRNDFLNTSFFWNMKKLNFDISKQFNNKLDEVTNWEQFIFLVLEFFGYKKQADNLVYGDKTPGYINHLELLKSICTNAKFIHIIRDPRDFCLSVKNIWNKHLFRAAYTWNLTLKKSADYKRMFGKNYIEIKYEDLISNAEETLTSLCLFLNINFEPAMCSLSKTAENYGYAKNKTEIVKDNKNNFLKKLSKYQIQKIEAFTFPEMKRLGYKPLYAVKEDKPSPVNLLYWKLYDAYNSARFHAKEKGILSGLSYFGKLHKQSSWRSLL